MLSVETRISVVPKRFFSPWRGRKRKIRDENTRRFTTGFGDNMRQFFICANRKYAIFRTGTAAVSALHTVWPVAVWLCCGTSESGLQRLWWSLAEVRRSGRLKPPVFIVPVG